MEEFVTFNVVFPEVKARVLAEGVASSFKLFKVSATKSEPLIWVSVLTSKNAELADAASTEESISCILYIVSGGGGAVFWARWSNGLISIAIRLFCSAF